MVLSRFLWLSLALVLTACAMPPEVQTQARANTNFAHYRTFALLPAPPTGPASDPGLMLRVAAPAQEAVREILTAKGFTETERDAAELTVNLRGHAIPRVEVVDWGYQSEPLQGRWSWRNNGMGYQDVDVYNYEERTLAVELFDNHTKELVWVGWTKSRASGPVKVDQVRQTLRRILAEFPPDPASATDSK